MNDLIEIDEYKNLKYEFGDSGVVFLEYDPEINRFRDNLGNVIHDIYRFVSPNQVRLFKDYRSQLLVRSAMKKCLVMMLYKTELPF